MGKRLKVLNNGGDQIIIQHHQGIIPEEGPGTITINELQNGQIEINFDSTYFRNLEMYQNGRFRLRVSKPIGLMAGY
jgi:hypothetical protein